MTRYLLLALAALTAPAAAQTIATLPVTCNASGSICTQATPVTNPDGSRVGGTPGTSGTPGSDVTTVQGAPNGTAQNTIPRGTVNLATSQVSVGTTATLVVAARQATTTSVARSRLVITQSAAGPCYYGPTNTVSATTGARVIAAGGSKAYQYAGALYGICPGGAVTTDVDEEF